MAIEGEQKAHEQTYSGFTGVLKWATIVTFIVTMIVIILISG